MSLLNCLRSGQVRNCFSTESAVRVAEHPCVSFLILILDMSKGGEDSDIVEVEAVSRPRHSQSSATHHLPTTSSNAFRPCLQAESHHSSVNVIKMNDPGRKSIFPAPSFTSSGRKSLAGSSLGPTSKNAKLSSSVSQPCPPRAVASIPLNPAENSDPSSRSRVKELLNAMRRWEVQKMSEERDRAFVQLIDYLIERKLYPDVILEHRPYSDDSKGGVEFRCSW